jgi:GAF domain-containing protein
VAVKTAACRFILSKLGADRVVFVHVVPGEHGDRIWALSLQPEHPEPDVSEIPSTVFHEARMRDFRAGTTVVVADSSSQEGIDSAAEEHHRASGVRAFVAVPVLDGGRWVVTVGVHQFSARAWTDDEIALIKAVAEETWLVLNRLPR